MKRRGMDHGMAGIEKRKNRQQYELLNYQLWSDVSRELFVNSEVSAEVVVVLIAVCLLFPDCCYVHTGSSLWRNVFSASVLRFISLLLLLVVVSSNSAWLAADLSSRDGADYDTCHAAVRRFLSAAAFSRNKNAEVIALPKVFFVVFFFLSVSTIGKMNQWERRITLLVFLFLLVFMCFILCFYFFSLVLSVCLCCSGGSGWSCDFVNVNHVSYLLQHDDRFSGQPKCCVFESLW
jgi:hypothetical protein